MKPLPLQLYRLTTALAAPIAPVLLRSRARRGKEDAARLGERLGYASVPRPAGLLAWLHGASVGESLSLLPLIDALKAARPDLALLVTSGTATSAEMMRKRLPPGVIHQFAPLDTPVAARRFMTHWRPELTVFVESEIWPNLILQAAATGSRLALLSARLSEASLTGWGRFPGAARALFGVFDRVMAQDDTTAAGLQRLGARDDGRLNLKRLGAPPPVDAEALAKLRAATDRPVLLAASTHPGEDEVVLDAFRRITGSQHPEARLVVAPRHPARAAAIEAAARAARFTTARRSQGEAFGEAEVYIADTLGELGLWFSLARVALIGGSLLPGPGGHNPVEAAQLGCPIYTGPHVNNWQGVYTELFAADAARQVQAPMLAEAFSAAVQDPASMQAQAARARHVVAVDHDALNMAAEALISLLL